MCSEVKTTCWSRSLLGLLILCLCDPCMHSSLPFGRLNKYHGHANRICFCNIHISILYHDKITKVSEEWKQIWMQTHIYLWKYRQPEHDLIYFRSCSRNRNLRRICIRTMRKQSKWGCWQWNWRRGKHIKS